MRAASGAELIERERLRQVKSEGYMAWHDDQHAHGELALAGALYALDDDRRAYIALAIDSFDDPPLRTPVDWPWEDEAWKPTPDDRVRELVKAGALIAAEIDRLLRAQA